MLFTILAAIVFIIALLAAIACNVLIGTFDDGTDSYFDSIASLAFLWGALFPCLFGSIAIWAASTIHLFAIPFDVYALCILSFIGVTGLVIVSVMHFVAVRRYRSWLAY